MAKYREPLKRGNCPDMDLPENKTCGDCVHAKRCCLIFGHFVEDESCDWSPSRFREAKKGE